MMKRAALVVLFALLLGLGGAPAGAQSETEYEYIDISNPFLRKIPLAVPWFKAINATDAEQALSREAADLVATSLEFTGYFKILDRGAFLADPLDPAIIGPNIHFRNWTGVGAELLITGGLVIREGVVEMELRLFDTFKERMLIGKRYKGWVKDYRRMTRRFCSEVILQLTGQKGVFDSRIAFVSTGSGEKEIYICEFDGYQPKQFTQNKSITLFPAWSSDGEWLAYTSYSQGKPDLYIRNIAQKRGAVISEPGIQITPAWVPGKFELAATLSFSGDQEIYLLTGTGKIIKRLTNSRGIDVEPTWAPDGKRMAFVSKRSGTPQVHIKDLESGRVERLTFSGRYNTQPSWSPLGDKIAYSSMVNGQTDIYVIDASGGEPLQLTRNQGDNESPSWSPDGSLIVFSSTREGPSRIYVMTAYGTDQRRLLVLPGEQSNPAWSSSAITN